MPRIVRSSFGRWVDPAVAFATLFGDRTDVVWLDSGPSATSGRSYLGQASRVVTSATQPSLLDFLRTELAANRIDANQIEEETDGFALGWVGWLGYETRFETMGVPRTQTSLYPDAAFLYLDRAIEFDHATRRVSLLSLGEDVEWRNSIAERLSSAATTLSAATAVPELGEGGRRATWRDTDDQYLAKIRACQAAIAAGDAYLLCLTTQVRVHTAPDPVATYLALRESSPSHHGALLRVGELALLSSSPEQFLTVTASGLIESRPIKGTRPRGVTGEADAALATELVNSEKERAENLMIVDLMRNDIGRVSRIGSVEVPSLLAVETYAHVHQLVSTIRGQLADGQGPMDAVVACFPAGSMTGTPKSSATRILDSLEDAPRGIYSGAFGYFGLNGRVDLAMVIRSIVISPAGATIGTGGGITALSDPDEELAEIKLKAEALLRALGAAG